MDFASQLISDLGSRWLPLEFSHSVLTGIRVMRIAILTLTFPKMLWTVWFCSAAVILQIGWSLEVPTHFVNGKPLDQQSFQRELLRRQHDIAVEEKGWLPLRAPHVVRSFDELKPGTEYKTTRSPALNKYLDDGAVVSINVDVSKSVPLLKTTVGDQIFNSGLMVTAGLVGVAAAIFFKR